MGWVEWKKTKSNQGYKKHCFVHHRVDACVTEERLPARLLLTFDIFYIPHVHLARNQGANICEESVETLSEATRLIKPQSL